MVDIDLLAPKACPSPVSLPVTRLFACFERCLLLAYVTDTTQFEISSRNSISIWEFVDCEWLTKVKLIVDRSVDKPKDPSRLMAVLDLWRRATAGYLEFRAKGWKSFQELPGWLSESAAEEILTNERRASRRREIANFEFWFCDDLADLASSGGELDFWPFTAGEGGPGGDWDRVAGCQFSWTEGRDWSFVRNRVGEDMPAVGTKVRIPNRIEKFGGSIPAGTEAVVSAAWVDGYARVLVSLSRGDRVLLSGVGWPIV